MSGPFASIPEPSFDWDKSLADGVRWGHPLAYGRVDDELDVARKEAGSRVAFDFMDKSTTFADFADAADRFAKGLQSLGYGPGSKIGMFLPNVPYYPIAYYGALRAGCTVVNFNPLYSDKELAHQASDSGTNCMVTLDLADLFNKVDRLMVASDTLNRVIVCSMSAILPGTTRILFNVARRRDVADIPKRPDVTLYDDLIRNDGSFAPVSIDPLSHPAALQYTGGTTGVPKGAVLTHANLTVNMNQAGHYYNHVYRMREEVVLAILPFFHIFGMNIILNLGIQKQAKIVMIPRIDMDRILKAIDKHGATFVVGVPSLFQAILDNKKRDRYDLSSIRFCVSGGAPLPTKLKHDFEAATGCMLVEGYGLSETSPVTHSNPIPGETKAGSIGLPMPGTDVRILSLDDSTTWLPQGERGEICIKGPQVMKGYWQNEQADAESFADGYFRTGDVGYIDEAGYTFIVDRIKDLILVGGYNIYPRRIEEPLYSMPGVEEVVVGGIPDGSRGEAVKAWVKVRDGVTLTSAEVKSFLRDKVGDLEMPRHVEIRTEPLPKTMVGKLSRKALIEEEKARQAEVEAQKLDGSA